VALWKRDLVIAALAARGVEADVRVPITSPANSRRRATLSGRRLKKGALVGFHPLTMKCEVAAYEAEEAMLRAMQAGWRGAEGLKRLETHTRDLFRRPLLPDELARFDAVVIDPPRAGAQAQMREIAQAHVPVVAAVSCNPESFTRDARILLDAGYSMGPVTVVDQFRWAPHVEIFARFSLA